MSLYGNMSLYAFPTICGQTLRALSRYPSRTAFSWPGGSLSYQGAIDLIGRMQSVFTRLGLRRDRAWRSSPPTGPTPGAPA